MKQLMFIFVFLFGALSTSFAQNNAIIRGIVKDKKNNEALPFANVVIEGQEKYATTDLDGKFEITGLAPALYNLQVSFVGYKPQTIFEVEVTNARPAFVTFELMEDALNLEAVEVTADPFAKSSESPVSLRSIGASEIKRSPGGNRDISNVIRTLPGVASTPSFRNDIIIRGGAPNESRFFIDGIEIPTINHFSTQGSSGGPVGMINVDLVKNVDFYAGAFPASRGNAMSAVFDFKFKEGRTDKPTYNFILGASDIGATYDGPISKNSSLVFSVRRSYLQFLFAALDLPFLPTYNDAQFKYKIDLSKKSKLTFLGIGALDQFELNKEANETEEQRYILNNLPVSEQWNYTVGTRYDYYRENGSYSLIFSRSHLNNTSEKYRYNIETPENLILDYKSEEVENKFRFEDLRYFNGTQYTLNWGVNVENPTYTNQTYNLVNTGAGTIPINYSSTMTFMKYGLFANLSRNFFQERLSVALGLRTDFNDYSDDMSNPMEQISPRLSLSYALTDRLSLNFNTGIYYQLPPYTAMGFRDSTGVLVNKENGLKYIESQHLVAGVEYLLKTNTKISLEGFYKKYNNYPALITKDSISLANLGADFGVIGAEPVSSISFGRSYGLELLLQQKLTKGFYGIAAFTLVKSEFSDKNGNLIPSAWDNEFLVSLTGGKSFKRNWDLGLRYIYTGGAPFTPNSTESLRKDVWDVNQRGIPDYTQLNTLRAEGYGVFDIRVDKKYFFNNWSINFYLDIQNVLESKFQGQPFLNVAKNDDGTPKEDPNNPNYYQAGTPIPNESGTRLPTFGIIVEL